MEKIELSVDKNLIGPWVFERIQKVWSPAGREVVGLVRGQEVLGGVVFEDYTTVCMTCHIALANEHVPIRRLLTGAAHYAYNQMGVNKLVGMVRSSNLPALKFDLRIGFRPEAVLKDVFPDGDLVVLSMTRDECKFLPRERKAA